MKKSLIIILNVVVFIFVGELVVRCILAEKKMFIEEPLNETSRDVEKTNNLNSKIFFLGDSYAYGMGIDSKYRFSNIFYSKTHDLINLSQPGNSWGDYLRKIKEIENHLKENDFIYIGVNWDDIDSTNPNEFLSSKNVVNQNHDKTFIQKIYSNSSLFRFLSVQIQNNLKRLGYPLPIGRFNYYRKKAYVEKKQDLDNIMIYLEEVSKNNNIYIILYLMPNFNHLEHQHYMKSFHDYFLSLKYQKILIYNGHNDFLNPKEKYYIDIFDGHPNKNAHLIMSKYLEDKIIELDSSHIIPGRKPNK